MSHLSRHSVPDRWLLLPLFFAMVTAQDPECGSQVIVHREATVWYKNTENVTKTCVWTVWSDQSRRLTVTPQTINVAHSHSSQLTIQHKFETKENPTDPGDDHADYENHKSSTSHTLEEGKNENFEAPMLLVFVSNGMGDNFNVTFRTKGNPMDHTFKSTYLRPPQQNETATFSYPPEGQDGVEHEMDEGHFFVIDCPGKIVSMSLDYVDTDVTEDANNYLNIYKFSRGQTKFIFETSFMGNQQNLKNRIFEGDDKGQPLLLYFLGGEGTEDKGFKLFYTCKDPPNPHFAINQTFSSCGGLVDLRMFQNLIYHTVGHHLENHEEDSTSTCIWIIRSVGPIRVTLVSEKFLNDSSSSRLGIQGGSYFVSSGGCRPRNEEKESQISQTTFLTTVGTSVELNEAFVVISFTWSSSEQQASQFHLEFHDASVNRSSAPENKVGLTKYPPNTSPSPMDNNTIQLLSYPEGGGTYKNSEMRFFKFDAIPEKRLTLTLDYLDTESKLDILSAYRYSTMHHQFQFYTRFSGSWGHLLEENSTNLHTHVNQPILLLFCSDDSTVRSGFKISYSYTPPKGETPVQIFENQTYHDGYTTECGGLIQFRNKKELWYGKKAGDNTTGNENGDTRDGRVCVWILWSINAANLRVTLQDWDLTQNFTLSVHSGFQPKLGGDDGLLSQALGPADLGHEMVHMYPLVIVLTDYTESSLLSKIGNNQIPMFGLKITELGKESNPYFALSQKVITSGETEATKEGVYWYPDFTKIRASPNENEHHFVIFKIPSLQQEILHGSIRNFGGKDSDYVLQVFKYSQKNHTIHQLSRFSKNEEPTNPNFQSDKDTHLFLLYVYAKKDGKEIRISGTSRKGFEISYTFQQKPHWENHTTTKFVENNKENDNSLMYKVGVPIVLLILALTLGLVVRYRKKYMRTREQLRQLTAEEIKEFREGNPDKVGNLCEMDGANAMDLPFDRKHHVSSNDYIIDRSLVLGQGEFGLVIKGEYKTVPVAIKTTKANANIDHIKALMDEIKVMAYVGTHENIVQFMGADTEKMEERTIHVLVELSPLGDLLSYLKKNRVQFVDSLKNDPSIHLGLSYENTPTSKSAVVTWCRQIASGMKYLESKKVIHGDLAARNVLLFENDVVKITDFGLARQLRSTYEKYMKKSRCPLPFRWMSLESLQYLEFSSKSDVWAYGVTMWELFSLGAIPYLQMNWNLEFTKKIAGGLRLGKPDLAPDNVYEIMVKCWHPTPDDRISFTELEDFWIKIFTHFQNSCQQYENTK